MAYVIGADDASAAPNHPHAIWMAIIASVSFNLIVGCMFGSFSVLIRSVTERMHVSEAQAALAGPLVILGSALIAVLVGELAARFSLRLLMALGAALSLAGYLLLAFTNSYVIYVATYALLFGPSMSLAGSVGPATLVTRWFSRHRGLALGLVMLSIGNAAVPVASDWVLESYGAQATYLTMAALVGLVLLPMTLFIRDWPPGTAAAETGASATAPPPPAGLTMGQIARQPVFWIFAMTAAMTIGVTMVLTFGMVQMAQSWGLSQTQGAQLQSIMATAGMAGSVLFGWVADRIGGARGLAVIAFGFAVIFAALSFVLPFALLVAVIVLAGLHGSGTLPNVSRALATSFGAESYSRAFGLSTALSVPATVVAVVGVTMVHSRTGSFAPGFMVLVAVLLVMAVLVFGAHKRRNAAVSPA